MTDNAIIRDAKRQIYQEFRVAAAGRVKSFLRGAARIVAEMMTRQIARPHAASCRRTRWR